MNAAMSAILTKAIEAEARKLAEHAFEDQPNVGEWAGKFRVEKLVPPQGSNPLRYIADLDDPLRFCHSSGYEFRTGDDFPFDGGSIPWIFQGFPRKYLRLSPMDFIEAYAVHDFACRNGWLWVRHGAGAWRKMAVSKKQADVILFWCLSVKSPTTGLEPTRLEAQMVYRAVRAAHTIGGN